MTADPEPMVNEVVGRHPWRANVCPRYCTLRPRAGYSQDPADYPPLAAPSREESAR